MIAACLQSRPARGAWIETVTRPVADRIGNGRAPRGARGLKHQHTRARTTVRASRPARGAWIETSAMVSISQRATQSRPARGAWIETSVSVDDAASDLRRAPRGARGLKPSHAGAIRRHGRRAPRGARGLKQRNARMRSAAIACVSRPARGAWIETYRATIASAYSEVAPRAGRVD